jgi:HSP20 family protein
MNTFDSFTLPTIGSMRRELARALSDWNHVPHNGTPLGMCPLSVWKDDKSIYVEADVPGFRRDEIELRFEDGQLWLRAERKLAEHHPEDLYNERAFGKFERRVKIADSVDTSGIKAELENGVLTVTLPKTPESQPHTIAIEDRTPKMVENCASE